MCFFASRSKEFDDRDCGNEGGKNIDDSIALAILEREKKKNERAREKKFGDPRLYQLRNENEVGISRHQIFLPTLPQTP